MKKKKNLSVQTVILLIVLSMMMSVCLNDAIDKNYFDAEDIGDLIICASISFLLPDALYIVPNDHTVSEKKRESSIYRIRDPNLKMDTMS